MQAFYTYFDHNYAVRAVAMFRSLQRNSGPFRMFMLALDQEAYEVVTKLNLPDVKLFTLPELELADPALLSIKSSRSIVEYYFTCTSCFGCYLMNSFPEIEVLTYLDSDLFFYSSVAPLIQEFQGHSIGAMYQVFPEHGENKSGRYNVGWVSWRRDHHGMNCLQHYRNQCLEWCYLRMERGKCADQAYLDSWEDLPGFHAFRHRGANVAPYNLGNYKLTFPGRETRVDGDPLIFFHFHKFSALSPCLFDTNLWSATCLTRPLRERLILPYIDELRETGLNLPLTGGGIRHFPFRHGVGFFTRNIIRICLSIARNTYVFYPPKPKFSD